MVAGNYSVLSDNFLLVADGDRIIQVDVETMGGQEKRLGRFQLPISVTSQPQVLAYDWQREDVYWTSNVNTSAIFKYSFGNKTTSVVYVDPTSTQK